MARSDTARSLLCVSDAKLQPCALRTTEPSYTLALSLEHPLKKATSAELNPFDPQWTTGHFVLSRHGPRLTGGPRTVCSPTPTPAHGCPLTSHPNANLMVGWYQSSTLALLTRLGYVQTFDCSVDLSLLHIVDGWIPQRHQHYQTVPLTPEPLDTECFCAQLVLGIPPSGLPIDHDRNCLGIDNPVEMKLCTRNKTRNP